MTKVQLLENLQDILERDDALTEDMCLEDIEEWDSLSAMGVMAFFNKNLSIRITPDEIREFKTIKDLIDKSEIKD